MKLENITAILKNKKVGIAGCGGLGSNCAVALARAGVGTLVIADFDVVTLSNLNRQYYFLDQVGMKKVLALKENILRINPETHVLDFNMRLTRDNLPGIFYLCDAVVEAFDLADQKQMIIETMTEEMPGTPLVVGLGMAGYGMNDAIRCRRAGNLWICGDETSEIGPEMPPIAPRVGMVACMQANVVMEILLRSEVAK